MRNILPFFIAILCLGVSAGAGEQPQEPEMMKFPGILLHVGKEVVTYHELEKELISDRRVLELEKRKLVAMRSGEWNEQTDTQYEEIRDYITRQVLGQIVARKLLYQEAVQSGYKVDEELIEREVSRILSRQKSAPEDERLTHQQIREEIQRQYMIRSYRNDNEPETKTPGPAEVRRYFRENRESFSLPEAARIRVIYFAMQGLAGAGKRVLARKIAEQLRENPENFAELAKEHSDDPASAQKGGLLMVASPDGPTEWIEHGVLPEELDVAIFSLPEGGTSGVIEVNDPQVGGIFIVKVEERRNQSAPEFAEVQVRIQEEIKDEMNVRSLLRWLHRLIDRIGVTDNEGNKVTAAYFFPEAAAEEDEGNL